MAEKENPADYGHPKTEGPLKGMKTYHEPEENIEEGLVVTADAEPKASTDTPDPNVVSVGDDADTIATGTNTGDANVTRSTNTSSSTPRTTRSTTRNSSND